MFFSSFKGEASKMNCISRRDDKDKNLFVDKTDRKRRWNLYSQLVIDNDMLVCAKTAYKLTDICHTNSVFEEKTCTLLDTNEVVDISFDYYS